MKNIIVGQSGGPTAVINASAESFNAYVANSSYWAFQKLGQYYHVGDLFMIIYALCNVISQLAVLILSIDAPLRMLLDNEHTKQFIPRALHKVNAHGVHSNGIKMVAVLSGSIILAQSFVPGAAAVLRLEDDAPGSHLVPAAHGSLQRAAAGGCEQHCEQNGRHMF